MARLNWRNNSIKLLSLLLAFVLWIYVNNEQNPVREKVLDIELENTGLGQDFIITGGMPDSVRVKVQGSRTQLANLAPWNFRAVVNIPEGKTGDMVLPVRVTVPAGLQVLQVSPKEVRVTVDRLVDRRVSVSVELQGEPAHGYAAMAPEIRPDTVIVRGPAMVVNKINQATAVVNIGSAKENVEQDVPVSAGPYNVSLSPSVVTVFVPVTSTTVSKDVPVLPQVTGSPARGFAVGRVYSEPASVHVSGPAEKLDVIFGVKTEPVDIQGADKSLDREVSLVIPQGVEGIQPDRVKVRVEIKIQ